jgi:hypothetical protein
MDNTEEMRQNREESTDSTTWADFSTETETPRVETKEQALNKLLSWANRGTLRQFYMEMAAKLAEDENHDVVMEGEGGFLGIGGHEEQEPVLAFYEEGDQILVKDEPMNEAFAIELAQSLARH